MRTSSYALNVVRTELSVGVRLLGAFEVRVDGRTVAAGEWRHRRAAELVKLLALAPQRRLHREQAIDALWPRMPLAAAAPNLRKAAHFARSTLGAADAVVLAGEHVALWPALDVEVDAARFERAGEAALRTGDSDACAGAAALYSGELLPDDPYAEWAGERRERLRALYLGLLARAGLWEDVAAAEPADEPAARALMRLAAVGGNRAAALDRYHRLRAALAQLELQPSPETNDLYRQIAGAPLRASPVRYVQRDGVSVAYQVVEGGPADLLLIPGWVSHLALDWEEPHWVRWCERMTSFARLVRFDKRGTGLSDRPSGVQPVEERMEDALAVLTAAGVERAHVLGWSEGGPLGLLLAAAHPDRVSSLVLYGTQACCHQTADYPWGDTPEEVASAPGEIEREWGSLAFASVFAPSGDDGFAERRAAYMRAGASPSAAAELNRINTAIDVRHVLPKIRVPTLVLARHGDRIAPAAAAAHMAKRIAGARFVEFTGDDHTMWLGDVGALCSEIERFVLSAKGQPAALPDRPPTASTRPPIRGTPLGTP
jgi:DNA-binding SARP family transcriptional activator/pimeloyl-ACP methyl ester carboxylesterase